MNILVITQIYPQPDDAGIDRPTRTVEYFAKEWVQEGHNVIVIHCPSSFPTIFYHMPIQLKKRIANLRGTQPFPESSRRAIRRKEHGIRIYRLPMNKLYPGQAFSRIAMKKQTGKILNLLKNDGFSPDLVMGHFANPSMELVANLAEHYRIPSSIVFHYDCTPRNIKKYRITELKPRIGALGVRSIVEAENVRRNLSLKEPPFLCYSGAPNDVVEKCKKVCTKHEYDSNVRHIYVGSMLRRKHVDALIRAFAKEYFGKDASLDIVGEGQEEDNLKRLSAKLGMDKQIHFHRTIPRDEVMKKMQEANVLTMVSEGETFGMVYIEAMLQGCIVIASKNEGFDGIIKDGVNGFLCNAGDEKVLKGIFHRIDNMTAYQRNAIGQNAIDTALEFSEKAVAQRYLEDVMRINRNKVKKICK